MSPEHAQNASSKIPEQLGRYRILGLLATGGMAEIYLAKLFGPERFTKPVAVKRILPHLASNVSFRNMFLDEARLVAGIQHTNVVAVHELCEEQDSLYLVMEYLEGESLANVLNHQFMAKQRFDVETVAYVMAEAAAGLHAAHELTGEDGKLLGLVHRDVSPQNIFLCYDGGVKIIDFGVAKARDRASYTKTGEAKGKFAYMAPEQVNGSPIDRRTDLFALGVVLFEMLSGNRLYKTDNHAAIVRAICDDPVPNILERRRDVPEALAAIVTKALQKNPQDRYRSGADFRKDLLQFLSQHAQERSQQGKSGTAPRDELSHWLEARFAQEKEKKRAMIRSGKDTRTPEQKSSHTSKLPSATQTKVGGSMAPAPALGDAFAGVSEVKFKLPEKPLSIEASREALEEPLAQTKHKKDPSGGIVVQHAPIDYGVPDPWNSESSLSAAPKQHSLLKWVMAPVFGIMIGVGLYVGVKNRTIPIHPKLQPAISWLLPVIQTPKDQKQTPPVQTRSATPVTEVKPAVPPVAAASVGQPDAPVPRVEAVAPSNPTEALAVSPTTPSANRADSPPAALVQIVSTPAGAVVSIDGKNIGITPFTWTSDGRAHEMKLSLRGYRTLTQKIQAKENGSHSFSLTRQRRVSSGYNAVD